MAALTSAELAALPVFPLPRVVFFPGSLLPLHLFEPRYRQMVRDCIEHGPRAMAVALLRPGWEADYEGRPDIHDIAGAGRIVEHRERPGGKHDLILQGLHRVRLSELPADGRPYRRAEAQVLDDRVSHPAHVREALTAVLASVSQLAGLVRREHPEFSLGLSPEMPPAEVADRLADRLVTGLEDRQRLLEAADVKVRLHILRSHLAELLVRATPRGGSLH